MKLTEEEAIEIIECGDIYNRWGDVGKEVEQMAIKALQEPKTEIIRCKDCKHWTNNIGNSELRDNYCNEEAHGFYYRCSGEDYCSFAERRTDG